MGVCTGIHYKTLACQYSDRSFCWSFQMMLPSSEWWSHGIYSIAQLTVLKNTGLYKSTPRYLLWQISDQSEIPRVFSNHSNCTNTITRRSLRGYLQPRTDPSRTAAMMMETKSPDTVRSFTITYTPRACKTGGILGKCYNLVLSDGCHMIFKNSVKSKLTLEKTW